VRVSVFGANECAITLECAQVISIGSHADVSVGAHCQECDALDAELAGCTNFEVSDLSAQAVDRTESDSLFEQGRVAGNLL